MDTRKLLGGIANYLVNSHKKNFDLQGFNGRRWQPRQRPDRKRKGRAILVDTGRLRQTLQYKNLNQNSVQIISPRSYAIYHNEGAGEIPKRQFMGITDQDNKEIERRFNDFVEDFMTKFKP